MCVKNNIPVLPPQKNQYFKVHFRNRTNRCFVVVYVVCFKVFIVFFPGKKKVLLKRHLFEMFCLCLYCVRERHYNVVVAAADIIGPENEKQTLEKVYLRKNGRTFPQNIVFTLFRISFFIHGSEINLHLSNMAS